jgi:hypothetical protein
MMGDTLSIIGEKNLYRASCILNPVLVSTQSADAALPAPSPSEENPQSRSV